jgi:hypothetical protein
LRKQKIEKCFRWRSHLKFVGSTKEILFDKLKTASQKQKTNKCFQTIKETKPKENCQKLTSQMAVATCSLEGEVGLSLSSFVRGCKGWTIYPRTFWRCISTLSPLRDRIPNPAPSQEVGGYKKFPKSVLCFVF